MYEIDASITEPTLLKVPSISDDRGYLVPITDDIDHDLFHRCYIVSDYGKGVIRGLHYHKLETKIFTIVNGAAKFVTLKLPEDVVDRDDIYEIEEYVCDNPDSVQTFVLSSRHHGVLVIPPYYANGWISLEDNTILTSLSNLRFEEAMNDDIRIDPYVVGDAWKVIGR
tara:strand:- start:767 stop:1270 length:504 start_codon:yes stop_codon:yes gene_type:complete